MNELFQHEPSENVFVVWRGDFGQILKLYDVISGLGDKNIIVLPLIFHIDDRPIRLAPISFRSVKPFLRYDVTSGFKMAAQKKLWGRGHIRRQKCTCGKNFGSIGSAV